MYRLLPCLKDTYITNKLIYSMNSSLSQSTSANVGQAGNVNIFKLFNQVTAPVTSGVELSRGLIHFDLSSLVTSTTSSVNFSDSSFKCYVSLKDVYGGQTVPSNFSLELFPLAKEFSEGRGFDVIGYRDVDAANWITASISGGVTTLWTSGGCGAGGNSDVANLDYYTFLSSSLGYLPLGASQSFNRGDEDLLVDVTTAISATLAGYLPDYGFRLGFSGSQETDTVTRFVKRFSSRQSRNTNLHPALIIKYNDTFVDNQTQPYFDYANKIGIYYSPFGTPSVFMSGSTPVVGSGSLLLVMEASRSAYVTATTYSLNHSMSISYLTSSWLTYSQTFTGSQVSIHGLNQTGSYYADVFISSVATGLSGVKDSTGNVKFATTWKSLDNSLTYSVGPALEFSPLYAQSFKVGARNYTVNITNLLDSYVNTDVALLRVFVYDYNPTLTSFYVPYRSPSRVLTNMLWRLVDPYSKEVLIPFDSVGTKLSSDGDGMYFSLYMQDLPLNKQLVVEFLISEGAGQTHLVQNQSFMFKVVTS